MMGVFPKTFNGIRLKNKLFPTLNGVVFLSDLRMKTCLFYSNIQSKFLDKPTTLELSLFESATMRNVRQSESTHVF